MTQGSHHSPTGSALLDRFGPEAYRLARRLSGSDVNAATVVRRVLESEDQPDPVTRQWVRGTVIREATALCADAPPASRPNSLEWAIDRLTPDLRVVWILRELEQYRHEEIAEVLGIEPETSEARCHRARRELSQLLDTNLERQVRRAQPFPQMEPEDVEAMLAQNPQRRTLPRMLAPITLSAIIALVAV